MSLVSNSNRKITLFDINIQSAKIIKNKKYFYEINHLIIINKILRHPKMINKIKISILKPCGENWETMTLSEKGKFCASCQKNVIDFTSFSDREIVKYYNKNSKVCGRFTTEQLNRNLVLPKEKGSMWMIAASSILAFLGLGNQTAKAQEVLKMEQTDEKIPVEKIQETKKNKTSKNKTAIISGIVTDGKIPLPGVYISVKGSKIQTSTDLNGNYTIEAKKRAVLVFSFIGFKSLEKKISESKEINIALKEEAMTMGEVIIIKNSNED